MNKYEEYQKALDSICGRCYKDTEEHKKVLQELIDKETPKKPRVEKVWWASDQYSNNHYCPECNEPLDKFKHNYCNRCGCKIDWSN